MENAINKEINRLQKVEQEAERISQALETALLFLIEEETQGNHSLAEYARLQRTANAALQALKIAQTEAQKVFDMLRYRIVPNALEDAGMERASIKDVGTVYLADDLRTQIKDMQALAEVLRKHGMGDLVREAVNSQTLKALIKEFMQEGKEQELLEELQEAVAVQPFTVARIRKS